MEHHPLAQAGSEGVQAPKANLSSNDPWRNEESPQASETPRLVLECKKPSSTKGDPGKYRKKDSRAVYDGDMEINPLMEYPIPFFA